MGTLIPPGASWLQVLSHPLPFTGTPKVLITNVSRGGVEDRGNDRWRHHQILYYNVLYMPEFLFWDLQTPTGRNDWQPSPFAHTVEVEGQIWIHFSDGESDGDSAEQNFSGDKARGQSLEWLWVLATHV